MEEEKETRRDFLRGLLTGVGAYVSFNTAFLSLLGYYTQKEYLKSDSKRRPSIVTEKDVPNREKWLEGFDSKGSARHLSENLIIDHKIDDTNVKMHGVEHTRLFALKHYWSIDDLVKNSMLVLSEGSPKDLENPKVTNDGKAYFGTMIELCRKYGKPIIKFDGVSKPAVRTEFYSGLAGTALSVGAAGMSLNKNISRRKAFGLFGLNLLGAYAASSSFILGTGQRGLIHLIDPLIREDYSIDKCLYSHIIDQRNVKFTDNMIKIIASLAEEDRNRGSYILTETGRLHTIGMEYYLNNRNELKTKKALYLPIYGMLDDDSLTRYTPTASGWKEEEVRV